MSRGRQSYRLDHAQIKKDIAVMIFLSPDYSHSQFEFIKFYRLELQS